MQARVYSIIVVVFLILGLSSGLPAQTAPAEVYLVPFSHLDLYWCGTREECLARGSDIIARAIRGARQNPGFRFFLEDNDYVANYVDSHKGSTELADLKRFVKEGRIEISPKWAAIFQNLFGGEAWARNFFYGKRYAREVFGVDPQVAHLGDLPGFMSQFPQLLAQSHTAYTVMTRMGPPDKSLFYWKAPDGTKALTWNAIHGYGWGTQVTSNRGEEGRQRFQKEIEEIRETTPGPIFMTWGSDLYAPPADLVEKVNAFSKDFRAAHFHVATPSTFFQEASKSAAIPELSGEIPSSWGRETTAVAHVWSLNGPALNTLVTAEKFAAVNYAHGYADYPQQQFDFLWMKLLEFMDHNQDGQGGLLGDEGKAQYARMALYQGGDILRDMLRNIAERVEIPIAKSAPIVVFNPMSWKRDDVVHAHLVLFGEVAPHDMEEYRRGMKLVDESGKAIPYYVQEYSENMSRALQMVFAARDVPPLGYRTYFLVPAQNTEALPNTSEVRLDRDNDRKDPRRPAGADVMENEFYRVSVDKVTGRVGVFDKALGRQVWKDMEMVGTEDHGSHYLRVEPVTGRLLVNRIKEIKVEENNGVEAVMRITGDIGGNPTVQKLTLYRGLKRLDLENGITWQEPNFMRIDQRFPFEHPNAEIHYGVPFGANAAANIIPGSMPRGRDEGTMDWWKPSRTIQDWVFAGNAEWGLTIAADHTLIDIEDGAIRAEMLKGTRYTSVAIMRDNEPDSMHYPVPGTYVFRYSLSSGAGDWKTARSYQAGMSFNNPLVPVSVVNAVSPKPLPPTGSFCSLEGDNLVISALKKSNADSSIVLRAFEIQGKAAVTPVDFLGQKRSFRAANLLEEDSSSGTESILSLRPFEIRTIKLQLPK